MREGFKTYTRLLRYMGSYWPCFLLGVLGTTIASSLAAGFVWFIKPLLNQGFITPNMHFVHWLPVIVIAGFLGLGLASFVGDYCIFWTARYVVMRLQKALFDHLLFVPRQHHPASRLVSTMIYNVEQVANASSSALMTILRTTTYIVALVITMFLNSWQLAFIFLCACPAAVYIIRLASVYLCRISLRIQELVGQITRMTEHVVRGESVEENASEYFQDMIGGVRRKQMRIVIANSLGTVGARMVIALAIAVSIYVAARPAFHLSAGAVFSCISAMLAVLKPLKDLASINSDIQKGIAGAHSVFEILDHVSEGVRKC